MMKLRNILGTLAVVCVGLGSSQPAAAQWVGNAYIPFNAFAQFAPSPEEIAQQQAQAEYNRTHRNAYGALAMDEYGMVFGAYLAPSSLLGSLFSVGPKAQKACEAQNPFAKCRVVGTVSDGSLALVWSDRQNKAFWATDTYLDTAKQKALAQCGDDSCQVRYWMYAPTGVSRWDEGKSDGGWLPANTQAVRTMLIRSNAPMYRSTCVFEDVGMAMSSEWNHLNPENAERSAKDVCQAAKQGRFRMLKTFSNTIMAIAYGKSSNNKPEYFVAQDPDLKAAKAKVMPQCESKYGTGNCFFVTGESGLRYSGDGLDITRDYKPMTEEEKIRMQQEAAGAVAEWEKLTPK